MTEQIGTLEELQVKPGDVVEFCAYATPSNKPRTVTGKHENGKWYHDNQRWGSYVSMRESGPWKLISRATPSIDLTAITTPFGLLDKATQDALIAHGGPYQWYDGNGWRHSSPTWARASVYRVKPGPKRETVTKTAWVANDGSVDLRGPDNCTITYDLVDDEIDMETYKVTKK